ncbi:MAG TPA: C4-type zinc ribbon domain-containing protein [Syntrophales bacterium]|nr:C4-type zinc ribbon domain-containing protein [Syntrophales bacterium]HPX11523.1 C4-type zinc ribbon domain-containing protein [Syntrophales bacterium]HQB31475.1 C4-type zinc ribbon domain-containing protein [Syntrophales bacterium]HQN79105.1 C4-type zinc ribbon domain-containing protein [Syntrophales bacterium]HQQ28298.1 C4-type zinc ribbon domain-containing protein [Syntrophales bacterium]
MKEQVALLIELQKLDDEILQEALKKKELPERIEKLREEIRSREAVVLEKKDLSEAARQSLKESERELKRLAESLSKGKSRLSEVKTNKEYQAMLKEMDAIAEASETVEDRILRDYERVDETRRVLEEAEAECRNYRERHEGEIFEIEKEIGKIDLRLEEIQKKHSGAREKVRPELIRRYDMIRQRRNGKAVVSVWKEVCGGCHVNIPPQLYNNLQRHEEFILCPHCNRILYWEDRNGQGQ